MSLDEKVLGRLANTAFHLQHSATDLIESFRPNQIECKKWLVQEIANCKMHYENVLVLGSWNSCLLWELMNTYCDVDWFTFLDINPVHHADRDKHFEVNNLEKNYHSITMSATDFSDHEGYDLIINTSCEHMPDIPAVYGPTYALQSNNYTSIREHINCCANEKDLAKKNNINKILFQGSKKMANYDRFMVIGYHQ